MFKCKKKILIYFVLYLKKKLIYKKIYFAHSLRIDSILNKINKIFLPEEYPSRKET